MATVPQYLAIRFDHQTQVITNLIFLVAYVGILLPIILYTGATGMIGIMDVQSMLGIESYSTALWLIVWVVGSCGLLLCLVWWPENSGGLRYPQR